MKHARPDYNRIQDPENLIPENEPVFLLRGKDVAAPAAIEAWIQEAKKYGAKDNILEAAQSQADLMRAYQIEVERQTPDMP
jgi:hypothetical protein